MTCRSSASLMNLRRKHARSFIDQINSRKLPSVEDRGQTDRVTTPTRAGFRRRLPGLATTIIALAINDHSVFYICLLTVKAILYILRH